MSLIAPVTQGNGDALHSNSDALMYIMHTLTQS